MTDLIVFLANAVSNKLNRAKLFQKFYSTDLIKLQGSLSERCSCWKPAEQDFQSTMCKPIQNFRLELRGIPIDHIHNVCTHA